MTSAVLQGARGHKEPNVDTAENKQLDATDCHRIVKVEGSKKWQPVVRVRAWSWNYYEGGIVKENS